ncbi:MAG TPA: hypothetical protein VGB04_00010 [Allosphingosinicella sp.]|jgi:hypothetical protein
MALPDILCGPIVRRATAVSVHVWLATSRRLALGIELYRVNARPRSPWVDRGAPIGRGVPLRTVKLGDRLFVTLLEARPIGGAPGFPVGELIAYDIAELAGNRDWSRPTLRRLDQLTAIDEVTLAGLPLPCLILQDTKRRDLRAFTMSCRKLHGGGFDAAEAALNRFAISALDISHRANALFLTGDQIYADDVAEVLAPRIQALGHELQGRVETLPGLTRPLAAYGLGDRQDLVSNFAGFTSSDAANHLLTFGEFAATYLLAWNGSDSIWGNAPASFAETYRAFGPSVRPRVGDWAMRHAEQAASVARGRRGSRAMRRLLANVPTYMIFDDHEVTDDWNLNADWTRAVRRLPLGERVVANALAAFWAFQGWGNNRDDYPWAMIDSIERGLTDPQGAGPGFDDALWDHGAWSFLAPTTPPTWFMDSRTGRSAPRASVDSRHWRGPLGVRSANPFPVPRPPFPRSIANVLPRARHLPRNSWPGNLLGAGEAARMRSGVARAGSPLITVAPAPVLGFELIEEMQDLLARLTGSYAFDLEHWHANPDSLMSLLGVLRSSGVSRHVILSGDVHYAFSARGELAFGGGKLEIAQVTASAAKNEPPGLMGALGVLQSLMKLYESLNPSGWGRFYFGGTIPGSYWIIEMDQPQIALALSAALLLRGPPILREEVRFDLLEPQGPLASNLTKSNVGLLTFDGARPVHRFTFMNDAGRPQDLRAQRYF